MENPTATDPQAGAPAGPTTTDDAPALPLGTVEGILAAPSDIVEKTVDVPEWGCSIRIQSLTAAQSAKVRGASIDMSTGKPVMNWEALEKAQFLYGVLAPKFSAEQVNQLHHRSGPGFARVIRELDGVSGTSPKAVKETLEAFQAGGTEGEPGE